MNAENICERLQKSIEWHRENQNDPHGIGNAVIAALTEVKNAIEPVASEQAVGQGRKTPTQFDMGLYTKVPWCDDTHNFWRGCTKVSPACTHCYAEFSSPSRVSRQQGLETWGPNGVRIRAVDFGAPLRWNKAPWVCEHCGGYAPVPLSGGPAGCPQHTVWHRRRVFSLSLGDWLEDKPRGTRQVHGRSYPVGGVPLDWLGEMLQVIWQSRELDFLLVTKRPENFFPRLRAVLEHYGLAASVNGEFCSWLESWLDGHPPVNVWVIVTAERQIEYDERRPHLLQIPAVVRGLSLEPLLEPIDLRLGEVRGQIHWAIPGGESEVAGRPARACAVDWLRDVRDQCAAAQVRCFVKQLGSNPVWSGLDLQERWPERFSDRKGENMEEWPRDVRVREFPESARRD